MKLLLTSNGLANKSIVDALQDLVDKPLAECSLAFIPTAANFKDTDKSWLINDLHNVKLADFKFIDIVDIAAVPKYSWLPRLEKADILLFGGGNTFFLLYWLEKSGLKTLLPDMLKTKIYIGISAGSIATAKRVYTSNSERNLGPELGGVASDEGLGLVDFCIRPHYTSPKFAIGTDEKLTELAEQIKTPIYAIDNHSAIKVVDGNLEIISEGKYKIF